MVYILASHMDPTILTLIVAASCLSVVHTHNDGLAGRDSSSNARNFTGKANRKQVDQCGAETSIRTDCHPEVGATRSHCEARGCCWRRPSNNDHHVNWCFYPGHITGPRCQLTSEHRSDCHPETGATQTTCLSRGCCWQATSVPGAPYCYHPPGEDYRVDTVTNGGKLLRLSRKRHTHWGSDAMTLQVDIAEEEKTRLRLKIYDPHNKRYEVPLPLNKQPRVSSGSDYTVDISRDPFGLTVRRKSSMAAIFDASLSPLIFTDQMIEITIGVPTSHLYGIGENRKPFRIQTERGPKFTLWATDVFPKLNINLYGSHPFLLGIENNGDAFGIFLLNSNAMRIEVLPTHPVTVRYRPIGGILDFYVFTGPSPDDVIDQFWSLIGRPPLPPYWSLGFHLSKWNYGGSYGLTSTIQRMRDKKMPFDTMWSDIDYMDNEMDWTYDNQTYGQLPTIVNDLHNHGQKYVIIVDPGIGVVQVRGQYAPYDDGMQEDIFVKVADGSGPIVGKVWPERTVFPDFTNPKTVTWWKKHAALLHAQLPFDGIWIDMNEPTNFVDGSHTGCTNNALDNPPYTPEMAFGSLRGKTLCPSSKHHLGSHYDLHSLYGYFEGKATYQVMKEILGKRPFVLSRSTFTGSGNHVAHWEGDNFATWDDMYYSITEVLSFNMFGIPFTGVDLCGFWGDSEEELCTRWLQLGAFFPFMRSHNSDHAPDKDPAASRFSSTAHDRNRASLNLRYRLLPLLYSLMSQRKAVVRPIVFQYPADSATYNIDKQFLWGDVLLISPVLKRGDTSVDMYFPHDVWYDFYTGHRMSGGNWAVVKAPLDKINVHVRGGSIIPTQVPAVTTKLSRQNDFQLIIAASEKRTARGFLYWDDGETLDASFTKVNFKLEGEKLTSTVPSAGYHSPMTLGKITIFGVTTAPGSVRINGVRLAHTYDSTNKVLEVSRLNINLLNPWSMTF